MTTIKTSIKISRPPEVVAEALIEPENAVQWNSNLDRIEVVSGKPGDVGMIAHLHYIHKGRTNVMEQIVELAEYPRRYVYRINSDGMTVWIETILERMPDGTQLTTHWAAVNGSFWARLLVRMLRSAIAQRAEVDLWTFKKLVETHGSRFPPDHSSEES